MEWWWHKFVLANQVEIIPFVPLNASSNRIYSLYWMAVPENLQ